MREDTFPERGISSAGHLSSQVSPFRNAGLTFIELIASMVIIGLILAIAIPVYLNHMDNIRTAEVASNLLAIELCIDKYYAEHGKYPVCLDDVGKGSLKDPWGRCYRYLSLPADEKERKKVGRIKNDYKLINKDFDLYSTGSDGLTHRNINNRKSWDDVIRASDGAYVGPAKDII